MKADRAWPPPFTLVHRARSNRCRNDGRSFLFLDRSIGRANEFKLASKSKTRSKSLLSRAKIISSRWSETIKSRYVNWLAEWRVSRLIYPRKMVSPRQLPKPVIPEICDSLLRVSSHRLLDDSYRSYQPRFQAVSNFDRVLEKGFTKEGRKEGRKGKMATRGARSEVGSVGLAISREPFYPSLTRGFSSSGRETRHLVFQRAKQERRSRRHSGGTC